MIASLAELKRPGGSTAPHPSPQGTKTPGLRSSSSIVPSFPAVLLKFVILSAASSRSLGEEICEKEKKREKKEKKKKDKNATCNSFLLPTSHVASGIRCFHHRRPPSFGGWGLITSISRYIPSTTHSSVCRCCLFSDSITPRFLSSLPHISSLFS